MKGNKTKAHKAYNKYYSYISPIIRVYVGRQALESRARQKHCIRARRGVSTARRQAGWRDKIL